MHLPASGIAVLILFFTLAFTQSKAQDIVSDPTGATLKFITKNRMAEATHQDGNLTWNERQDQRLGSPSLLQLIVPDTEGAPEQLLMAILSETAVDIKILDRREISSYDWHGFKNLGSEGFLYTVIQRKNPFSQTESKPIISSLKQFSNSEASPITLVMQSDEVKTQTIQNSAAFKKDDLFGKWMQVLGHPRSSASKYIKRGEILHDSRCQAHIIAFAKNVSFTISYLYDSVNGVCKNRSEASDQGTYTLNGKKLIVNSMGYSAQYIVCGIASSQQGSKGYQMSFQIGVHPQKMYFSIYGSPLSDSVNITFDQNGQEYILEGFIKMQNNT